MKRSDQMILVTNVYPVGGHLGGWRAPGSFDRIVMNLDAMIEIAKLAERGKFHSLFLADGNAVRQMEMRALFENVAPSDRPASFEPTTVMAAISQHTKHIGLFVTATTTFSDPYSLARLLSSLDHISKGRATWNVVTTSYPGDAVNFGGDPFPPSEDRYRRAIEFVEVCKDLWDSWAEDAFPQDKATGKFLDADKVRKIDHHGEFFDVQGPLNIARMPQGYPVFFMAGQSEPGRELAAKHAECLFVSAKTKDQATAVRDNIRARMPKYGRDPSQLKFIPGVSVIVAPTREEAYSLRRELADYVSDTLAAQYLSAELKTDMSIYDPDGPFPELSDDVQGLRSTRDQIVALAKRESLTVRQTWQKLIGGTGNEPFTGTASDVADQLQDWFESGACDGFMLSGVIAPRGLEAIVDLLIPELQSRGLYHADYVGGTLRDELGLITPVNRYFTAEVAARGAA